ncbi:MAG: DUF937 domain-containing protein [Gemmatimonadaceae bacterium]
MSGIADIVQQHLTPDIINQISHAIGADPATTQQAIDSAIPAIVGGMANHAATPGGSAAIQAAADDHAGILGQLGGMLGGEGIGGGLLGNLASMVEGAGSSNSAGSGGLGGMFGGMLGGGAAGGILGNILGGSHSAVTDGVSQASGLDKQKTMRLLMILAPIVLAAVARHRNSAGASAAPVGDVLQQEAEVHASNPRYGGILGGILNKATGQA